MSMDPTAGRDWIDYLTLVFSAAALIISISAVVYTHKGYRIGSKRDLKLEIATAIATDDPLRVTVHNLGGPRRFEIRLENMVVPANDHRTYDLNRELVKYEWQDELPRLGDGATLEIRSISGACATLSDVPKNLLLDGIAAAWADATASLK